MLSNTATVDSASLHRSDKSNFKSIYHKFHSLLRRGSENMSAGSTVDSEDSFSTPVSSVRDLMALSPKQSINGPEQPDMTSDFLTGVDFDNICDVSMPEVPTPVFDDTYINATGLDYLKRAGSYHNNNLMDMGKESLYVKFDPLYARRAGSVQSSMVDSVECDIGYDTGSSASIVTDNQVIPPKHCVSTGAITVNNSKDKPTQVVPPVVNEIPKTSAIRSTPALMRSVSAILTPTQVATDLLISISGNTPPTAAPRSPYHMPSTQGDRLQSLRIILQKQDQDIYSLTQVNNTLRLSLQNVESKYNQTIEDLESKVKKFNDEKNNLLERENKLIQQVNDKVMSNKQMSIVMEEYEKTISSLIGEQQREKILSKEILDKTTMERDQALNHLTSMESSFNDLLAKYEKCKTVLLEAKDREKGFVQKISEYEVGMKKYEIIYNDLKQLTSDNLANANETLELIKKNHNVEIMKLNATIKKHEIKISSLEESLVQKTRDNEELTRICDQLINEVR